MSALAECLYNLRFESDKVTGYLLEEWLAFHDLFPTIWEEADHDYICQNLYYAEPEEADAALATLKESLSNEAAGWGIDGEVKVSVEPILRQDWAEVWKQFFHVKKISNRIVIKPSWEAYEAATDEVIIEIDPGMSFGTGQHGTTQACLQFLDDLTATSSVASMLDAGTGSGILSIGAAKLGIRDIRAFDFDPDAVRIAKENLSLNQIDTVEVTEGDLYVWPTDTQYDVVVANILCPILMENAERLIQMVKPDGHLILAGILDSQYDELKACFVDRGLKMVNETQINEWKSGIFAI